jgi:hypothetical protein
VTAVLNSTGQIVLPPELSAVAQFQPGEQFGLMISTSGNLMLRRERSHQRSLMEHFRALNGLEIKRRRDAVPPPPEL